MQEIYKSIKATLYDRIENPILSSFLISWFVCNWKIFLALLSPAEGSLAFRIDLIYRHLEYASYWRLLGIPVLATLFWVFVFPFILQYLLPRHYLLQTKLRKMNDDFMAGQLLTREESVKILLKQKELGDLIRDKEAEIRNKESEISILSQQLRKRDEQEKNIEGDGVDLNDSKSKFKMLNETDLLVDKVSKHPKKDKIVSLLSRIMTGGEMHQGNANHEFGKDIVDYCIVQKLLTRRTNIQSTPCVQITSDGETVAKRIIA